MSRSDRASPSVPEGQRSAEMETAEERAATVVRLRTLYMTMTLAQLKAEEASLANILAHADTLNLNPRQIHDFRVEAHTLNEILLVKEKKRKAEDDLNPLGKKRILADEDFFPHHKAKSLSVLRGEQANLERLIEREGQQELLTRELQYIKKLIARKKRKPDDLPRKSKEPHLEGDNDIDMAQRDNDIDMKEHKYDNDDTVEIPNRSLQEILDEIDSERPRVPPRSGSHFTVPASLPSVDAQSARLPPQNNNNKENFKISGNVTLTPKPKRPLSRYNIIYGGSSEEGTVT